jgi:hypothetical protein
MSKDLIDDRLVFDAGNHLDGSVAAGAGSSVGLGDVMHKRAELIDFLRDCDH